VADAGSPLKNTPIKWDARLVRRRDHGVVEPGRVEVCAPAGPDVTQESLGAEGQLHNLGAVRAGTRVFSAYELRDGTRIWIITEADRSVTTILLPEEY
jgi:hypothetical protein